MKYIAQRDQVTLAADILEKVFLKTKEAKTDIGSGKTRTYE